MAIETPWDAFNLGMGVASFAANAASGNVPGAILDGVGVVYDGVATFVPGLPGGAGTALKAARAGKVTEKVREAAAYGRKLHEKYKLALGEAYEYNVAMLKSKLRPDAIDYVRKIVRELKPDSPSGHRKGVKQLKEYVEHLEKVTGDKWQGFLDFYKPLKK